MPNPMIRIHNIETNEVTDREMTDAELATYESEIAAKATESDNATLKAEEKAALLDRLGMTAEEAALLLS